MKRVMKIISSIIAIALCMGIIATAFAADPFILNESEMKALSEALQGVEMQKTRLGLAATDFNELRLGEPVQTYIYINDSFEPGNVMYPIMDNGRLILWAIRIDEKFQITTALVDEISRHINNDTYFSIIYDRNSSYLYANGTFTLLATSIIEDDRRSVFNDNLVSKDVTLDTTALSENVSLEYSADDSRTPIYYECDVDFVSQNPPSNMCWAATVACIVNYRQQRDLTAITVAKRHLGPIGYDKLLDRTQVPEVFGYYGESYTHQSHEPSDEVILGNIMDGYPLYTSWSAANGSSHAVCLYGANVIGGYLYIMDPEYGFTSACFVDRRYRYVSGYSNMTMILKSAVCHSW